MIIVSGPCVIESEKAAMEAAEWLVRFFESLPVSFIFKSSYDKANRSSISSFRGPGLEEGLKILEKVKTTYGVPIFTDVHSPQEAYEAAAVCDVIQIPAFLCRQTDLLVAAGKTGATVNIKKGQYMAPWDMEHVIGKITSTGNENIMLTERGTSFGYNNLVSDLRNIPLMQKFGYPVLFDATHSVQLPGGLGNQSGGDRQFIPTLSAAAIAAGCDGIYAETHPNPKAAKCDAACMLPFDQLSKLVDRWLALYEVSHPCSSLS
ncbi:MAG: 2-dehydro-3-deoxyphosphooctonate aldolase [Chlamydiales bacterium]|nr:2-dehydro-3-deoxyphosphooctonate aldolase [Chlamydiales bacterium]MCH9619395.1 2-dehydro-3-deoxyphosphooctonate aldolase [Chlamydiales bacterium]MCH9622199.1 2-dehydro-3-deoxyphosphooctonate aldolase [Chlamydiales bacterium]